MKHFTQFFPVTVRQADARTLTLELPNGGTVRWPVDNKQKEITEPRIGDRLVLTLTSTTDILREFLMVSTTTLPHTNNDHNETNSSHPAQQNMAL